MCNCAWMVSWCAADVPCGHNIRANVSLPLQPLLLLTSFLKLCFCWRNVLLSLTFLPLTYFQALFESLLLMWVPWVLEQIVNAIWLLVHAAATLNWSLAVYCLPGQLSEKTDMYIPVDCNLWCLRVVSSQISVILRPCAIIMLTFGTR